MSMHEIKKKINRLIKKLDYLSYIIIMLIGLIMLFCCREINNNHLYVAIMGIGGSLVASAIVTLFLFLLLPDDAEIDVYKDWGIEKVIEKRSDIKINKDCFPKKHLDIIAFDLLDFKENNISYNHILKNIKDGLQIRIITINPNSIFLLEHQNYERNENLKEKIFEFVEWIKNIQSNLEGEDRNKISIKYYDTLPLDYYCLSDFVLYVGGYMPGKLSRENLTYQIAVPSRGYYYYDNMFESIWNDDNLVCLEDCNEKYPIVNIGKAVNKILLHYCEMLNKNNMYSVEGVVVLFKGSLRRTLYSSRNNELCRIHNKNYGTVGKLVEFNNVKDENEYTYIYHNCKENFFISKLYNGRDNPLNDMKEELVMTCDDKKTSNKNEVIIVAAPLYVHDKFIGALTFDFIEKAGKKDENIKEESVNGDIERKGNRANDKSNMLTPNEIYDVENIFELLKQCSSMIVPLLGYGMDDKYKVFYEEDWGNV